MCSEFIDVEDYDFDDWQFQDPACSMCGEDCAEDVDCQSCGLKFWIRACQYGEGKKPWPRECPRCVKGIPPSYEY